MVRSFDRHSFIEQEFGGGAGPSPSSVSRNLVFVIMSFNGKGAGDVLSAVKDECSKLGLNAQRVDDGVGSGFVIKEIVDLIKKAEFIICDLTHERPNVYYELGYAHGVGNKPLNILLIAKSGTRLHFDVAPLRVQYFRTTKHLRSILAERLAEMIRLTRAQREDANDA